MRKRKAASRETQRPANPELAGNHPPAKKKLAHRLAAAYHRLMSSDLRFMNELFRIVNGALRLDIEKVRNYTAFLADKLESSGDVSSANRLRRMLEETDHQLRPAEAALARTPPVDSESRFPLLQQVKLKSLHEPPLVLGEEQWDVLREFLSVAKSHGQLDAQNLSSSLCLLLYGPPGTGKNRIARYIATELGLDLYLARLDGLISSFLGSTSKNIRALFDFTSSRPCVLFLDEFDAIAKVRGDAHELGELKRVVNSFIQNLDFVGSQSIVVAATNHDELLDAAIWRRFNYRLKLEFPDKELRRQMWQEFLGSLSFSPPQMKVLVDLSEGFSGSDIHEVSLRLQRRKFTAEQHPELKDAFQVMRNIAIGEGEDRRFLSNLRNQDAPVLAAQLRRRNAKLYSHATLAQLFGVSKATAHRWAMKGEETHA